MILYFSGTGNSAYVANVLGEYLQDEVKNIFDLVKDKNHEALHSEKTWVVVTPTYAWRIPRVIHQWLQLTELLGNNNLYFVMTCGGSIGNASVYNEKLCKLKKMQHKGTMPVIMPENYVALYKAPNVEESLKIMEDANPSLKQIANLIKQETYVASQDISIKDKLNSGLVNDIYYPLLVHAKKFYATDSCIACGKCAHVCPLSNIHMKDGKPVWGNQCTHCMACICKCPNEAIEYGKHTIGKQRYTCPK